MGEKEKREDGAIFLTGMTEKTFLQNGRELLKCCYLCHREDGERSLFMAEKGHCGSAPLTLRWWAFLAEGKEFKVLLCQECMWLVESLIKRSREPLKQALKPAKN
jgi:hypothetical protein